MAENSKISWTDHSYNPWIGCTKVAPGCVNCYAEKLTDERLKIAKWGPDGTRHKTKTAKEVRRWNRKAVKGQPKPLVFVASLADVAEDRPELEPWRAELCDLILESENLQFQLLTKRPENLNRMFPKEVLEACWAGTSVSDQKTALQNIPELIKVPAKVRFLSCEPLLGPVQFTGRASLRHSQGIVQATGSFLNAIDWVIVGGESGPGAREFAVDWAEGIIAQCLSLDVSVFFKQLGELSTVAHDGPGYLTEWAERFEGSRDHWPEHVLPEAWERYRVGLKKVQIIDPEVIPESLRVQQMPERELVK